jgi:hypothetical protein
VIFRLKFRLKSDGDASKYGSGAPKIASGCSGVYAIERPANIDDPINVPDKAP